MATLAPAIMALSTSWALCTPLVRAKSTSILPYSMEIQRSGRRRSPGGAQFQGGYDFQFFQVKIRLVETIE